MNKNNKQFNLKEFSEDNNITHIHLNDGDFIYIEMPKPENATDKELGKIRGNAEVFFEWVFKNMDVRYSVEFTPLKFTVITKKEEFVARLNDDIVQL